eukprot:COSAG01_NODE_4686_length_4811_cov_4.669355_4_plen_109_part_00
MDHTVLHVAGYGHTLPMIDAFAAFRCSCYDIPTASPPQALSLGDVALAHGPAWPDPSPLCAQTPRTAPCDAFPRRYVDPRVHGRPPPFRIGASSRDGRLTPAQMGNAR